MNLANLPGEDDDAGKSVEFDFHQIVFHFSVGKLLVQIVLTVAKKYIKNCIINSKLFLFQLLFLGHHGRHSGDAGAGGGNSEENSSFVSGGVGEKRTRFVLNIILISAR
jgi:hypothetical protein